MRTLVHPGPVHARRVRAVVAEAGRDQRIHLAPGQDLLDALLGVLVSHGIVQATALLIGGSFARVHYLTGQPDPTGRRVATYGAPTRVNGPSILVSGNVVFGLSASGEPTLHCHAVIVDADGRLHGGHLPPGTSTLGPAGAVALVTPFGASGFRTVFDAETNFPLFEPAEWEPA